MAAQREASPRSTCRSLTAERGARHLRRAPVYHKGRRYRSAAGYVSLEPLGPGTPGRSRPISSVASRADGEDVELKFMAPAAGPDHRSSGHAANRMRDCEAARIVLRNIGEDEAMRRFPLGRALEMAALDCARARLGDAHYIGGERRPLSRRWERYLPAG